MSHLLTDTRLPVTSPEHNPVAFSAYSAEEFADQFAKLVPGIWRKLTIEDVNELTKLELIKRHRCYTRDDIQTARSILTFILWCEGRVTTEGEPTKPPTGPRLCKKCHKKLKKRDLNSMGRPKIYCPNCYLNRRRDRNKPKAIEQAS